MAKPKSPLFSFSAKGRLSKAITYVKRGAQHLVQARGKPEDPRSLAQISWRHMYLKAVALWHELSAVEKRDWESLGSANHMTGYAFFLSQCLKPNPGIYLPLQGGTMQGDILMADHRILTLPDPTVAQEAATKAYHDNNLTTPAYTEGCRLHRNLDYDLPNNSLREISWNSETYDTDNMHDQITNPERITFRTPGKYLVCATIQFDVNGTNDRYVEVRTQGTLPLNMTSAKAVAAIETGISLCFIYDFPINNYINLLVWQNSGGNLLVKEELRSSMYFMAQRIG